MPADYVALAQELPAVYQDDAASFAQLDGYLSLVDEVLRTYAEEVADVPSWLSPAASTWPPGVRVDAGADEVHDALVELYDVLAGWFAFRVPGSWREDAAGMVRRREFASRAVRLWRRRGTPRGFVDWFCLYFGVQTVATRPVLLEHFKYGTPAVSEGAPAPWLRATLYVPTTAQFRQYARRAEAAAFVQRYAPSHVLMRLCWGGVPLDLPGAPPARANLARHRKEMRARLCGLIDRIDHDVALHLGECVDEGWPRDRLDVGRLPTEKEDGR